MKKFKLTPYIGTALVALACGSYDQANAQWPGDKRNNSVGTPAGGWPGSSRGGVPATGGESRDAREHFFCTFSPAHRAMESAFSSFGAGVPPCPRGAARIDSGRSSYFSNYFSNDRRAALLKLIKVDRRSGGSDTCHGETGISECCGSAVRNAGRRNHAVDYVGS